MIEIDDKELKRVEKELGALKSSAPSVIANALNRVGKEAKKKLPDVVEEIYKLDSSASQTPKSKGIMKQTMAKEGKLSGILTIKTGSLGLNNFYHYYGADVAVGVRKGDMKIVKDAFAADVHGMKIWKRAPGAKHVKSKNGKPTQLPIYRLYSTPVGVMFQQNFAQDAFDVITEKAYETYLQKGIDKAMKEAMKAAK